MMSTSSASAIEAHRAALRSAQAQVRSLLCIICTFVYMCICMDIYISVYIYICLYVFTYIYIHICIHISIYIYIYICAPCRPTVCAGAGTFILCMFITIYQNICTYIVYRYRYIHICIYIYIDPPQSKRIVLPFVQRRHRYDIYIYISMYMYMYIYIYIYMYVHI